MELQETLKHDEREGGGSSSGLGVRPRSYICCVRAACVSVLEINERFSTHVQRSWAHPASGWLLVSRGNRFTASCRPSRLLKMLLFLSCLFVSCFSLFFHKSEYTDSFFCLNALWSEGPMRSGMCAADGFVIGWLFFVWQGKKHIYEIYVECIWRTWAEMHVISEF